MISPGDIIGSLYVLGVLPKSPADDSSPITISDNIFTLKDNNNATKRVQFELANIAASTLRTLSIQNVNGTIALVADVDTLRTDILALLAALGTMSSQNANAVAITGGTVRNVQGTGLVSDSVGFRIVPPNIRSTDYTVVAADSGVLIVHPSTDASARTVTLPSHASVAFPDGTVISFMNQYGAGVLTIIATSDTLRMVDTGMTGNRTLTAPGIATAIWMTNEWLITGGTSLT